MKPVTSGFGFVDLIIPGLHKANGISRLLKRWKVSPQACVAIGDSGNDAEMLKLVKYSFAMGNAADSIKEISRYTTDDNNHQGALNVIQAVLDNHPRSTPDPFPRRSPRRHPSSFSHPVAAGQDFKLALTFFLT